MNLFPASIRPDSIVYPDSDGKPMADNTRQMQWIILLVDNLKALYQDRDDVFVAGDNLWYPVEGHPEIHAAPDAYVVFGRPKGDRGSYRQWQENNIPLTVVFEILSPGNDAFEMIDKHTFYEDHGVEEYYIYDPDNVHLAVYLRRGALLRRERQVDGFVSPRLKIRFDLRGPEMVVHGPDGKPFLTFEEVQAARVKAEGQLEAMQRRMARLAELSRNVRLGQATAEEPS
jgi:Uma2 family endonuclease